MPGSKTDGSSSCRFQLLVALCCGVLATATAAEGPTTRVSVDSSGAEGNGASNTAALSASGRFVAFRSASSNLVAGDTNGKLDIFVRDRKLGTTERVSVDSAGAQADGDSLAPAISANGRFVAFMSDATNLVEGDTNGVRDVFVHDRKLGTTVRVSVDDAGTQGDGASFSPALSASGRFVAFDSNAANLVAGDRNAVSDVFLRDLKLGTTERVSVDPAGGDADAGSSRPSISASGRFVAFQSAATQLVTGDLNGATDVFVRDRKLATTTRASVDDAGAESDDNSGNAVISGNGRFVAFESGADDLVPGDDNVTLDVFVHDRKHGTTVRVSVDSSGAEADDESELPSISRSGRLVAFTSLADNLVAGDANAASDVFVRDLVHGKTTRASVDSAGAEAGGGGSQPVLAGSGRFVAFESDSSDLVAGDANGASDVFVHDRK